MGFLDKKVKEATLQAFEEFNQKAAQCQKENTQKLMEAMKRWEEELIPRLVREEVQKALKTKKE